MRLLVQMFILPSNHDAELTVKVLSLSRRTISGYYSSRLRLIDGRQTSTHKLKTAWLSVLLYRRHFVIS